MKPVLSRRYYARMVPSKQMSVASLCTSSVSSTIFGLSGSYCDRATHLKPRPSERRFTRTLLPRSSASRHPPRTFRHTSQMILESSPWTPMTMAKMVVEHQGHAPGSKEYENQWRALYAHYVWLCQTKHPTMPSVIHDTSASAVRDGYVVMALPNVRPQDLPLKAQVAIISLHRAHESIEAFVNAFGFRGHPTEHPPVVGAFFSSQATSMGRI